ncbi:hypothetical protein MVEN_01684700 [Mycena venus]|uniref:Uncharacterized protein n=1 Tax=Mycena venus TaxID=2733690 RepID=A0A8H6XP47_9AGAR|nr:hypothetical protein MVEN_01684700 [Mycena venus]
MSDDPCQQYQKKPNSPLRYPSPRCIVELLRDTVSLHNTPLHYPTLESSVSSSEWLPSGTAPRHCSPPRNRLAPPRPVYSHQETVDIRGNDLGFKYRMWYTWYLMEILVPETAEDAVRRRAEFWAAMVSGDLWLWEEEDEECIKVFVENHHFLPILEMPREYWDIACAGPYRTIWTKRHFITSPYTPDSTSLHRVAGCVGTGAEACPDA